MRTRPKSSNLELAWSIKDLYGIARLHVYFVFLHLILLQNVFLKHINIFVFFVFILIDIFGSHFLVPSWQRNHRKYFAKENFHAPAWTLSKFYYRKQTGNPKQAASLHIACSGSQSQHGIWHILPAHGATHIIMIISK